MLLAFRQKQCEQVIIDSDFALMAFFLRTLDAQAVCFCLLKRTLRAAAAGDRAVRGNVLH
jgi:hypothetical protein